MRFNTCLEVYPQPKLHAAESFAAQSLRVDTKSRVSQRVAKEVVVVGTSVKARGIRDVVDFPGKLDPCAFAKVPALAQRGINVEDAIRVELVAHAGFSGIGKPHR